MPDLITYSPDIDALGTELLQKRPKYAKNTTKGVVFNVPKVPTKRKGKKSLSMVSASEDEVALLSGINNLQVLGTRDEVFADPAKLAIYREFYPAGSTEVTIHGNVVQVPNPEMPIIFRG